MLTVATFLWYDDQGQHNKNYVYKPADVARLQNAVARHLTVPHEFICLTDREFASFEKYPGVLPVPMRGDCRIPGRLFDKLEIFRPLGAGMTCEEHILCLDLDTVITGNIDHLVIREEDNVFWRNPGRWNSNGARAKARAAYNSSVMLLRPGTPECNRVWHYFHYQRSFGTDNLPRGWGDQDVISHALGAKQPYWDHTHGVYRLARDDEPENGAGSELPANACIVTFPGDQGKPWLPAVRDKAPWIGEHWPL